MVANAVKTAMVTSSSVNVKPSDVKRSLRRTARKSPIDLGMGARFSHCQLLVVDRWLTLRAAMFRTVRRDICVNTNGTPSLTESRPGQRDRRKSRCCIVVVCVATVLSKP